MVTIGIEDPEVEVDEDAGTAEVCVRVLDGELNREVIVTLSTSDGTAIGESPGAIIRFYYIHVFIVTAFTLPSFST